MFPSFVFILCSFNKNTLAQKIKFYQLKLIVIMILKLKFLKFYLRIYSLSTVIENFKCDKTYVRINYQAVPPPPPIPPPATPLEPVLPELEFTDEGVSMPSGRLL